MFILALILSTLAVSGDFDALWRQYHAAGDPLGREVAWRGLQQAGWPDDFDLTVRRLRERAYESGVPRGLLRESRRDAEGLRYPYILLVPETYDPQRAYPVQVVLHGSTRRPAWREGEEHWRPIDAFRNEESIVVFPAAWDEAMWWSHRQVANLGAILDLIRARYHVDSNRCTLTGVSDGGTGTFYHALRAPTPWAAFLPLIGHPWVLGNPDEEADGEIFAANLRGRALFVVNGQDDPLYPAAGLESYLDLFERAGATIRFKVKPGGHTVRWWPEEAAEFRQFRAGHPRDPFLDLLTWETDDPRRNGRAGWLLVEAVGGATAPDPDPLNTVLFPELDPPTRAEAFPRRRASGRVTAQRRGNTVTLESRNVTRIRLLLSPDEFDFASPVQVIVGGEGTSQSLAPSVETLMKWAIEDGDPAMLVGAEIVVEIPASTE